ncbi:Probable endopeptidase Spr precursor [Leminorella richardii]|uniref:Probable endopeptidase Spr n=1 Tax=Leminorella richardii TaxID=158841 RepID=A0A2X4V646_9GAMM|nr:NlpC/P60 family protein [Leminorella richardii]SQI40750.1 Probable endopeptidase Spr precursor [Leminorella richardii]
MRLRHLIAVALLLVLAGCSSHRAPPPSGKLSDPIYVLAQLKEQHRTWHGAPYRYGGMSRSGVDCSGFVLLTFQDRFNINLPRTTRQQANIGSPVSRTELMPGDLVFFKTGRGENGLHVGIYDADGNFLHASTSKGVMTSSLDSPYWKSAYWQSRRL